MSRKFNHESFDENKHTPQEENFDYWDNDHIKFLLDLKIPGNEPLYRIYLEDLERFKGKEQLSFEGFCKIIEEFKQLKAAIQKEGLKDETFDRLMVIIGRGRLDSVLGQTPHEYDRYLHKYEKSNKKQPKLSFEEHTKLLKKYDQLKNKADKNGFTTAIRADMDQIVEKCLLSKTGSWC